MRQTHTHTLTKTGVETEKQRQREIIVKFKIEAGEMAQHVITLATLTEDSGKPPVPT